MRRPANARPASAASPTEGTLASAAASGDEPCSGVVATARSTRRGAIRILGGDNLGWLEALATDGVKVELAYLDPPFFTQRSFHRTARARDAVTGEVSRVVTLAFEDKWSSLEAYLAALEARVVRVRDLLTSDGSIVVHVDPTTSHYVKVMLDRVFGRECFASEIVWRYRRWPAKTPNFQRVHDVLLRYVRDAGEPPRFVQQYEPLAPSTRATWGDTKQLASFGRDGRRVRSTRTEVRSPGVPLGDVWEIGVIAPIAKERTGYPTQKPEALLRRLIEACTYPGDTVLDPYLGSGTTLAVAAALGRDGIGIDASEEALSVAAARLDGVAERLGLERR